MSSHHIARDITYATAAKGRGGRAVIRTLENATGRLSLLRRARGYQRDLESGADFWDVMTRRYGLTLEVTSGDLSNIPSRGPLILVANHPFGVLDGLMLGRILSMRRGRDFRILAHHVFAKAPDLHDVILPISFDETKDATRLNVATRVAALEYLRKGGAIGVFPGGTVSTAPRPFGPALDPRWRSFTAKMIARSDATVVPVYFEGTNSRLFQLASHLHCTLRMSLLIREFKARVDSSVRVVVGDPISNNALQRYAKDPIGCMDFLRKATYDLGQDPLNSARLGHEFEAKYKGRENGSRHF